MNKEKKYYTVKDLEQLEGVTRKTLFYYDKAGLLTPHIREGVQNRKLYGKKEYERLQLILKYRNAGLTIEEIQMLLEEGNHDKEKILSSALLRMEAEIQKKQKEIENLKKLIEEMKEKPLMSFLTNTGIYIVEPEVIDDMIDGENIGFPDIVERQRKKGRKVAVFPVSENDWMDMGQLPELEKMRMKLYGE